MVMVVMGWVAVESIVAGRGWGSSPLCLPNVGGMDLSELGGKHGGRHPIVGGQVVELAAVVAVGNPHGLAIGKAGGRREAHRVGV